jgi:hypothetical protein
MQEPGNVMSDLEERLRDAIDASLADAGPKFDVMAAVRNRHRWRLIRAMATSVVIVALAVAAGVLIGVPRIGPGSAPATGQGLPVFPGGGRLLFADSHGLKWLYPDGKTVRIAAGFSGAEVAAGRLVAWDKTGAYVMNPDGSGRRLVLPFRPGQPNGAIAVAGLSPDGSRVAYYVGADPVVTGDTLWVADLATGRRVGLGRVSSAMWRDNSTFLASSVDGSALLLISAQTGGRSVYLKPLSDQLLIRAYQRAWPGAGRPAVMNPGGFSGSRSSAAFAVELAAAGPFVGRHPAEAVLLGAGHVVTYAPVTKQQFEFKWGPGGLFLIQTGAGDDPPSWRTYVGSIHSDRLAQPVRHGTDAATFSPAGNVLALKDGAQMTFLPTPRPACQATGNCLDFQPMHLKVDGTLLAWVS